MALMKNGRTVRERNFYPAFAAGTASVTELIMMSADVRVCVRAVHRRWRAPHVRLVSGVFTSGGSF